MSLLERLGMAQYCADFGGAEAESEGLDSKLYHHYGFPADFGFRRGLAIV